MTTIAGAYLLYGSVVSRDELIKFLEQDAKLDVDWTKITDRDLSSLFEQDYYRFNQLYGTRYVPKSPLFPAIKLCHQIAEKIGQTVDPTDRFEDLDKLDHPEFQKLVEQSLHRFRGKNCISKLILVEPVYSGLYPMLHRIMGKEVSPLFYIGIQAAGHDFALNIVENNDNDQFDFFHGQKSVSYYNVCVDAFPFLKKPGRWIFMPDVQK